MDDGYCGGGFTSVFINHQYVIIKNWQLFMQSLILPC